MRYMWDFRHIARAALTFNLLPTAERRAPVHGRVRRGWQRVAAQLAVLTISGSCVLFAWALFWPPSTCLEPLCARARFAVSVEIDALQQVRPIALEIGHPVPTSLAAVMRSGGVEVNTTLDQLDIPYESASGPLDQADLYQFTRAWRSRTGTGTSIYALLAPALVSDRGVPLFGLMFDTEGREGFAVAPSATVAYFGKRESESIATLQLRTFAHELLHALNRHHLDAAQMLDGRLTLEAPTRCIAGEQHKQWFLSEAPLMAISPSTIQFFQTAALRDVLPGKGHSAFNYGRTSPTECGDVRQSRHNYPVTTRWEYALRRIQYLFSIRAAAAAQESEPAENGPPSVVLRLQTLPASYPLGYPVAVRLQVQNLGETPLPLKGRLHPGYGLVSIEYRRAGASRWQMLQPVVRFEPADDDEAMLARGALTEETVPIYFSESNWTFKSPGNYEVRARLLLGAEAGEALSPSARVRVSAPTTGEDRAALRALLNERGELDDEIGRAISFGGRIGSRSTLASLESTVRDYGQTALGSALRLTLISQRLRRAVDPLTGERPPADLSGARELLEETCPDSGVAAMKQELLQRYPGTQTAHASGGTETPAAAWDGTIPRNGTTFPTYSDPSLRTWGPSVHFCFDSAQLNPPARNAIRGLARQLQRDRNTRVVVVGHGDGEGSCRYNDALSVRRAESVKRALVRSGVRKARIQVASLGERRPLDFASSDTARQLNRRVEILLDNPELEPGSPLLRVMPKCPVR